MPIIAKSAGAVLILWQDETLAPRALLNVLTLPDCSSKALDDLLFAAPSGWLSGYRDFHRAIEQSTLVSRCALDAWNEVIEDVLARVWMVLIEPLRTRLQELGVAAGAEIVFCSPGRLALLPLHAAGWHGEDGRWRCLLDDYAVSYVPSPQALVAGHARSQGRRRQARTLLAITNPTADGAIEVAENPACPFFPPEQRKELRRVNGSSATQLQS